MTITDEEVAALRKVEIEFDAACRAMARYDATNETRIGSGAVRLCEAIDEMREVACRPPRHRFDLFGVWLPAAALMFVVAAFIFGWHK